MIKIVIAKNVKTEESVTISSEEISAVVFPCSSFELFILQEDLRTKYGFTEEELIQPRMTEPILVDWIVDTIDGRQPISVNLWCLRIKNVWVCFVEPASDMFSYTKVDDWLRGHFTCTWRQGNAKAFFDPMNFHNCIFAVKEAIAKNENELQKLQ